MHAGTPCHAMKECKWKHVETCCPNSRVRPAPQAASGPSAVRMPHARRPGKDDTTTYLEPSAWLAHRRARCCPAA
eukprot:scaffold21350_cov118-Isochrysis_galbana.AAC.4